MKNLLNLKKIEEKLEEHIPESLQTAEQKQSLHRKIFMRKRHTGLFLLVILLAAGLLQFAFANQEWRAVFLTNNQVYFGKFWNWPFSHSIVLRDVYYLQVSQPIQPSETGAQPQMKVIKLGNEIHGPKSEMHIPMTQVLFWEGLRNDSPIVKVIIESKKSNM